MLVTHCRPSDRVREKKNENFLEANCAGQKVIIVRGCTIFSGNLNVKFLL